MATDDFIRVAYPVIVCVAIDHGTALAEVTARSENARAGIRCGGVVVAGGGSLATDDFVRVADAIVVRGAIYNSTARARITARGENARTSVRCGGVVVAGGGSLATYDFVRIAYAVVV